MRLALDGLTCPVIRDKLDHSKDFVQIWCYAYRDGGIEAIRPSKQRGRTRRISPPQETQLKARLDAGPLPRDGVSALRGRDVARIAACKGFFIDGCGASSYDDKLEFIA